MKILQGTIPTEHMWRVMVLLSPTAGSTLAWQLGLMLARANQGDLMGVVMTSAEPTTISPTELAQSEETLAAASNICTPSDQVDLLIVQPDHNARGSVRRIISEADVDLVIADTDQPFLQHLNNLPCTVATLRGSSDRTAALQETGIRNILMPTSGGPHTARALELLRQLPEQVEIEALYVSRSDQGQHEEALGHARLDSMLEIADSHGRVSTKVIVADNPMQGIVDAASEDYDLVVLGASQETSIDKALFGDVVTSVVRDSKVPVLVVQHPQRLTSSIVNAVDWRMQRIVPRLTPDQRRDVYVRIRENAQPDLDYFVLITLSAAIAGLGLILNSPAVVIGAMLVAPLMSPIVATGLAMVLGDARFLRFAFGSALRGALVAILVGFVLGLLPGNNMSAEVLARTAPNLLDLGVAFFSGLAGAFALSYWQAAGALPGVAIAAALVPPLASVGIAFAEGDWRAGLGALLLFTTNYLMIAVAAALVFFVFGFRPNPTAKANRQARVRTAQLVAVGTVIIVALLSVSTVQLFRNELRTANVAAYAESTVQFILGEEAEVTVTQADFDDPIRLSLAIQSPTEPTSGQLELLQTTLGTTIRNEFGLDAPLRLRVLHQNVTILDP